MDQGSAVRVRRVSKSFGDVVALDAVDLDVAEGEVHGLVGPNGAGKSTLLGLLLGLTRADGGRLEVLGTQVGRDATTSSSVPRQRWPNSARTEPDGLVPTISGRYQSSRSSTSISIASSS